MITSNAKFEAVFITPIVKGFHVRIKSVSTFYTCISNGVVIRDKINSTDKNSNVQLSDSHLICRTKHAQILSDGSN